MLPPAPPLFSMTTDTPYFAWKCCANIRATRSAEPPALNGTTSEMDLCGQAPWAPDRPGPRHVAAALTRKSRRRIMSLSPPVLESMCPLGTDGTGASRSVPFRTATATPGVRAPAGMPETAVEADGVAEPSPRAPADEEAPPRFWATVVSGRGGKARPFRHVCHVRDGGPPGSW